MEIMEEVLPHNIWYEAEMQANRSTLKNFRTGAIIFNPDNYEIIARGCSHVPIGNHVPSIHAEHHALQGYRKNVKVNILVVCIGKGGNYAFSARPCYSCADKLLDYGIEYIYYLERTNNGHWICNIETPAELLNRTDGSVKKYRQYAKEMRL